VRINNDDDSLVRLVEFLSKLCDVGDDHFLQVAKPNGLVDKAILLSRGGEEVGNFRSKRGKVFKKNDAEGTHKLTRSRNTETKGDVLPFCCGFDEKMWFFEVREYFGVWMSGIKHGLIKVEDKLKRELVFVHFIL
jgi:hypothetical protein